MSASRIAARVVLVLVLGAGAALGAEVPAAETPRALLAQAEAAYSGSAGRVDEARARQLFERAAESGDPVARMRLETIRHLGRLGLERDRRKMIATVREAEKEVRAAALSGDDDAAFVLGSQALFAMGRRRDDAEALEWYRIASRSGHLWALHNLAWMSEQGRGVEVDPARAEALYRKAAEGGNAFSMRELGRLLTFGDPQRSKEGLLWLRRSADRDLRSGRELLGSVLLYGQGDVRPSYPEAFEQLRAASEAGSLSARNDLAYANLVGLGGAPDRAAARAWFARAVELENPWAMVELGWLEIVDQASDAEGAAGWRRIDRAAALGLDGVATLAGFRNDRPIEIEMIERDLARLDQLAATGSRSAQALLATVLYGGYSSRGRRESEGVRWARQAAEAGEPHAMRTLAHALRHGNGVEADPTAAIAWLRRGAELGESFCAMRLSQELRDGHVVPRDLDESRRWLERSAEIGNYWSMLDLGNLYSEGWDGQKVDFDRAAQWKKRTAALGDQEAIGWLRVHFPEDAP